MNRILRLFYLFIPVLCAMCLLASCEKEEESEAVVDNSVQNIMVLFNPHALGDHAFNDNVFEGLYRLKENYTGSRNVVIRYKVPQTEEEAERNIQQWIENASSMRRLLVIVGSNYAEYFCQHPEWRPSKNSDIVFIDSDLEVDGIYCRNISLYGLGHLSGQMVKYIGFSRAAIVMANPLESPLREAARGFMDGFRSQGGVIDIKSDIYYLADNMGEGFDQSDSLFSLAYSLSKKKYPFVFPLCGGSVQGLYRFVRSVYSWDLETFITTCGVDADMQNSAASVIFSIVKRYDLCLEQFLSDWIAGKHLELRVKYGLDSPFAEFITAEDLFDSESFGSELLELKRRAVDAEKQYLNN